MFHSRKPNTMNSHHERPMCVQGDSALVLTTDPKPRLRWTVELHDRFIDAVTQLGGPDKATPKTIMRVMGVKGLTLYHLKSHLQKFRLGKQPHKEYNNHSVKDGERDRETYMQRNAASASGIMGRTPTENYHIAEALRMQMEVQRRLHEHLEVQKHLQMRIEAQGKYMQSILEKACQTLAGENMAMVCYNGSSVSGGGGGGSGGGGGGSSMSFLPFQELQIYGNSSSSGGEQQHHLEHSSVTLDDGKKQTISSNPYGCVGDNGKGPMIWADDVLRLRDLGSAALCMGTSSAHEGSPSRSHEHLQLGLSGVDNAIDIDSMSSDIFDAKPGLSGDVFSSSKLEISSPRRVQQQHHPGERLSNMIREVVICPEIYHTDKY